MLNRITLLLTGLLLMAAQAVFAQNTWPLEKCIQYAQQNNLSTKQAQYNIQDAQLMEKLNQFSRLPNLSARTSAGYQFGRTIDPTTNSFNNQRIGFNSFSIDAGMTAFGGGQINNSIKQSKKDLEAARLEAQATSNDISLNIASAYLSILLAEEQLQNARKRLELSQEQLGQTDKLIQAGSLPPNDRLDFLAQIALDEQSIVDAQNQVAIGYLNLKQLMEIDPNEDIRIVRPESIEVPSDADPRLYRLEEVYTTALKTQPQIRAADLRLESAQLGEDIARAGMLPTLNLFASLNTNYSSAAQTPIIGPTSNMETVYINDMPVDIEFRGEGPVDYEQVSYSDQINENFGQTVGASLSIPIYSNHRNRIQMERARLNALNTEVINRQQRQQLKSDVQRAIADARAARESYAAAGKSVDAAQAAFDNAEKRFQLGAINTLEYTTARNNLDRAQVDLIQAKYQYIFNLKTVDFYLGRPINLD
ncbi:MAG: TolC family protein [Lewinellaceae bacterium]|nr:TolC family protein [Lewinellaceae bacterium]MCB9287323.1 TolC family protein [Lewinellaceae bacterium]